MPERFVDAAGVRTRVLDEGAGAPALLVHGIGGCAEDWTLTIPALRDAGYHAIACDMPGQGRASRPRGVRYFDRRGAFYVHFLTELLDALALERVHLVGHSLGGTIATMAAIALPARLRSLTLAAPGGFGAVVRSFRVAALPLATLVATLWPTFTLRESVAACFHDVGRMPAWYYGTIERYARAGAAAEFTRVLRQGLTLRGIRGDVLAPWLDAVGGIALPTLLVWGRQDVVVPYGDLAEVRRRLPHAHVAEIEGAGHLVQLERPEEFNRALLGFLRTT